MAVTVTDRRTTVDAADSTTGWTGAGFGTTTTDYIEGTAAVADAINIGTGQVYYTSTGVDITDTLVYIMLFNNALQNSWTTGATAMLLGDGTNQIAFHIAGGDRFAFRHLNDPVNWNCCVFDETQMAGLSTSDYTVVSGTYANWLTGLTSTVDWGGHFITQSKALGGGYNVAVDVIRYGNDGLRITGGTTGARGTWSEIETEDRAGQVITSFKGFGVIRELQPGIFGVQCPFTFGDSGTAGDTYFEDTNVVVVYENWDIADDKYYLNVEGISGSTNSFELFNSTIASAGPNVTIDCSGGNVNTLTFDTCVFSQLGNAISFSNNADATGHNVVDCTFDGCGQIDPGDVTFERNLVTNTSASTTGAVLLDADGVTNWDAISFVSGGTGHAIYITATGTYTFNNFTYSGYGSTGTTNAVVYNDSGGAVTINVNGGDTPTYRNGTSATTTVNNTVTHTLTGIVQNSEVTYMRLEQNTDVSLTGASGTAVTLNSTAIDLSFIESGDGVNLYGFSTAANNGEYSASADGTANSVALTKLSGSNPSNESAGNTIDIEVEVFNVENVTVSGSTAYVYSHTVDFDVRIQVHKADYVAFSQTITLDNGNATLPIEQTFDVNYSNP